MPLTLSVLDQSPVRGGESAANGLRDSIRLAQFAEQIGYSRYWVAEHHNTGAFAGTSPEILIGQIAARTSRIRVGSGGVMLSHYSALKVAEQFRMLEALFPGRIDLGIGRAPGSDPLTAAALAYPRPQMDIRRFPQQVSDLIGFLEGSLDPDHPFHRIQVLPGPAPARIPEVWLLGSSDYSAQLAASQGLPFAFADFFGTTGEIGPSIAELYRQAFQPGRYASVPRLNVTVRALCAPTAEEAHHLGASHRLMRAANRTGQRIGLLPPEQAAEFPLPAELRLYAEEANRGAAEGNPAQVHARLLEIAAAYGTEDIGIVTNCYAYRDRARSYALIAAAFGLIEDAQVELDRAEAEIR